MKQLLCLLLALPLVLLAACSDDEGKRAMGRNPLVGIWTERGNSDWIYEFTFNNDLTGVRTIYSEYSSPYDYEFTYVFDEERMMLYITFYDSPDFVLEYEVYIDGDRLDLIGLTQDYEDHHILYKSDGGEDDEGKDDDDDPDDSEVGDDYLAGQWVDVDGPTYIFTFSKDKTGTYMHADNKGNLNPRSFTYSYNKSKGKLSITFNDNKSPKVITFDIRVSGAANYMIELTCTSGNFIDLILIGSGISS